MAVLKALKISATGDFGPGKSHDQLRKWIEANGGKWVSKVSRIGGNKGSGAGMLGLTHLICDRKEWKRGVEDVQTAQSLGAKIVTYDWLEDSLQKRRRLSEKKYLLENVDGERRRRKDLKRLGRAHDGTRFEKGSKQALEDTGSGTSLSVSVTPHKPKNGGFFVSCLEELGIAREKREAEAEAKRMGKSVAGVASVSDIDGVGDGNGEIGSTNLPQTPSPPAFPVPQPSQTLTPSKPALGPNSPQTKANASISAKAKAKAPSDPTSTKTSSLPSSATTPTVPKTERLTDNHHIYVDKTGFYYNILLLRANLAENIHTSYNIRLFESNTLPHTYCTFIRYSPPGGTQWHSARSYPGIVPNGTVQNSSFSTATPPSTSSGAKELLEPDPTKPWRALLSPLNSDFETAFSTFRAAFYVLTFLPWEHRHRHDIRQVQESEARRKRIEPFVYKAPAVGLPVGVLPCLSITPSYSSQPQTQPAMQDLTTTLPRLPPLPGSSAPLTNAGMIGSAVLKAEEQERALAQQRLEEQLRAEEEAKKGPRLKIRIRGMHQERERKKAEYRKPIFG